MGSPGRGDLSRHCPPLPPAHRDRRRRLADGRETPLRATATAGGRARLPAVRGPDGHRAGGAGRGGRGPRGAGPGAAPFPEWDGRRHVMSTVETTTRPMTAEEFCEFVQRPENANRWLELVRGQVIELPVPLKT